MKRQALFAIVCATLLAFSPTHGKEGKKGKESGEKGGTADINIGVGELQGAKARPGGSLGQPAPANRDGNPDRPLIRGSVPNPKGNDAKSSRDAILKGKKVLQN